MAGSLRSPWWGRVLAGVALGAGLPGLAGAVRKQRVHTDAPGRERARHRELEAQQHARQARAEERRRIACELHDVAAHELSAMVIQLGAAERQAAHDPHVRRLLGEAREQGSATLAQLRQATGVLRDEDGGEPGDREPPPSLARARQLVEETRRAGCAASLTVDGDDDGSVPSSTDRAGYRVLQESLAAARRHTPGAEVTARVGYRRGAVQIEVANHAANSPPPHVEGGHGLTGLRERVSHAGGELTTESMPEGGWRVRAVLPGASNGSSSDPGVSSEAAAGGADS